MFYKFLDSGDTDLVLIDGTAVVSSLSYFRRLELGDIGDPLEGGTRLTVRDAMVATEGSPELAMLNAANIGMGSFKQFAKIEGGGQISFAAGASFVHLVPELFIYSFSVGDIAVLTEEMCVKASKPYDACLRITEPIEFGRACFQHGIVRNLDGRRVDEIFENVALDKVEYVPRIIDVTEGPALEPSPYKKEVRFQPQSEMRLVFIPRAGQVVPEDRLIVVIPNPREHFDFVFKDRART